MNRPHLHLRVYAVETHQDAWLAKETIRLDVASGALPRGHRGEWIRQGGRSYITCWWFTEANKGTA